MIHISWSRHNSTSRLDEIAHIERWGTENNLKLNCTKSKEIIFKARGVRGPSAQPPPPCLNIERVSSLNVLGVIVNDRLSASDHVSNLLESSSRLLYAFRVLHTHTAYTLRVTAGRFSDDDPC